MANRKGSVKRGNRGMMAMSVGVPPPDPSWPPEMHLWHAVLVQGLMDLKQGCMFETESFELICDTLGLEPDYVRRKFNESLVEANIRAALKAKRRQEARPDAAEEGIRGGVPD
jgi:hypothetical protein